MNRNLDLDKVLLNARQATTEDLLNRVTVFRGGMEPDALDILEGELWRRGVKAADISAYEEKAREVVLWHPDGLAMRCSFCTNPAISQGWGWHRLFGRVPLFPRFFRSCKAHQARKTC